jgi:hypothetical protein
VWLSTFEQKSTKQILGHQSSVLCAAAPIAERLKVFSQSLASGTNGVFCEPLACKHALGILRTLWGGGEAAKGYPGFSNRVAIKV